MKVTWAIQTNLLSDNQVLQVWNAATDAGCNTQEIIVIPFSDEFGNEIPEIGDMVIPYGSTKLNKLGQTRGWKGLWFNPETFRADVWVRERDDMLNSDALFTTVRDVGLLFDLEGIHDDQVLFIRPMEDLKAFNGTVTSAKEIKNWMNSVYSGNFSFSEDTEIVIAPVQKILKEARFFVVGGEVVDGSWYRIHGQLLSQPITDPEMLIKVQSIADKWLPHECCVMDLAVLENGDYKVIEFNAINSSGFYYHDITKIVQAMTNYLIVTETENEVVRNLLRRVPSWNK